MAKGFVKNRITAAIILAMLLMLNPKPAHAQFTDLFTEMNTAMAAITPVIAGVLQDYEHNLGIQATLDGQDKAIHDKQQLENAVAQTQHAEVVKVCPRAQRSAASHVMRLGMHKLSGGMAGSVNQGQGLKPAAALQTAAANGHIDPSTSPVLCKALGGCKLDTSYDAADADIRWSNIVYGDLSIPPGLQIKNGVLTIPGTQSISASGAEGIKEKQYIAALNYCVQHRGPEPASLGGMPGSTDAPNLGTVGYFAQRQAKLATSPTYTDCLNQVNYHAAISQDVANKAGNQSDLYTLYTVEQQECAALASLGVKDPVIINCQANGVSLATLEEISKARFGYTYYQTNLQGLLKPDQIRMLDEEHEDAVITQNLLREVSNSLHAIVLNSQPNVSPPSPSASDRQNASAPASRNAAPVLQPATFTNP